MYNCSESLNKLRVSRVGQHSISNQECVVSKPNLGLKHKKFKHTMHETKF